MLKTTLLFILLFSSSYLTGQSEVLDKLILEALGIHPTIKEKTILLEKNKTSLTLAKQMFKPDIHFGTTYTVAAGGRSIAFPIGDLLNPVYNTLNKLVTEPRFNNLENQNIQFLPHNFYDARFRISQPILRPEIKINQSIKQEQIKLSELSLSQEKRDLIKNIKTAYFNYLQSTEAVQIYKYATSLVNENQRVSQSLIKNGVALPSTELRILSDLAQIAAQKFNAEAQRDNAGAYFNFLLSKNTDAMIPIDTSLALPPMSPISLNTEPLEIKQIQKGIEIQKLVLDLEKKYYAPKLGAQLDIGSQNFLPDWGGYILGGLSLEIPIWDNHKNKIKQKEMQLEMDANDQKINYIKQANELAWANKKRELAADLYTFHSYDFALIKAQKYLQETNKKYKEGLALPIELLDAQNQITNNKLQQSITRYRAWTHYAELESMISSN